MRYKEIIIEDEMLEEEQVLSSWIEELDYDDANNSIIMSLLSGRTYYIYDADEDLFDEWVNAPSKGKFWHRFVRDFYQVMPI